MNDQLVVTEAGKEKAANLAVIYKLPATVQAIKRGENPKKVKEIAEQELLNLYSQCVCGEGSASLAERKAEHIFYTMLDYPK